MKRLILFLVWLLLFQVSPAKAMQGGEVITGDQRVVPILNSATSKTPYCSGVLYSEQIVLTARHCIMEDSQTANSWVGGNKNDVSIFVGKPGSYTQDDDVSTRIKVSKVVYLPFPNPEEQDTETSAVFSGDIAFLFLPSPLLPNFKTEVANILEVIQLKNPEVSDWNKMQTLGYGISESLTIDGYPRKQDFAVIPPSSFPYSPRYIEINTVITLQDVGKHICGGDSGGPSYIKISQVWKLVSITNGSSSKCIKGQIQKSTSNSTIIFPYLKILQSEWDLFQSEQDAVRSAQKVVEIAAPMSSEELIMKAQHFAPWITKITYAGGAKTFSAVRATRVKIQGGCPKGSVSVYALLDRNKVGRRHTSLNAKCVNSKFMGTLDVYGGANLSLVSRPSQRTSAELQLLVGEKLSDLNLG
jgi:hypothetical protein